MVIPNSNRQEDRNHIFRFDPELGCAETILMPEMQHCVSAPNASWLAWTDKLGRTHLMSLPDGKELWTTPVIPIDETRAPIVSIDGRFLFIPNGSAPQIEVWDVAKGNRVTSLTQDGGEIQCWKLDPKGFLFVGRRNAAKTKVNVAVYDPRTGILDRVHEFPC